MRHWPQDILLTRRGLITCVAGLVVGKASYAGLTPTPTQTAGPFYPDVIPADSDADLTRIGNAQTVASGEIVEVSGRILSVKGHALPDAVVEIWQADANGRYLDGGDGGGGRGRDRRFQGYGMVKTRASGEYRFRTVRPAPYGTGAFRRTPHIHFRVLHGSYGELVTQMYFPGEPLNDRDMLYRSMTSNLARDAATAQLHRGGEVPHYSFDLVLA